MNPEIKEKLRNFILKNYERYPEEVLLDWVLKHGGSKDNFNECLFEIRKEQELEDLKEEPNFEPEEKPMKTTSIRLSEELIEQIDSTGYGRSEFIRECIKHYFKEHFKKNEQSDNSQ